jgi:hypothetical protein
MYLEASIHMGAVMGTMKAASGTGTAILTATAAVAAGTAILTATAAVAAGAFPTSIPGGIGRPTAVETTEGLTHEFAMKAVMIYVLFHLVKETKLHQATKTVAKCSLFACPTMYCGKTW